MEVDFTTKDTKITKVLPYNDLSTHVLDCAFKVHKNFGPGLSESIYEESLCIELANRNIRFERQKTIPVFYEGKKLEAQFRIDLVVDNQLIIEAKAIDKLLPIHRSQILNYLKLSKIKTGLLINFNTTMFKEGVQRVSL